MKELFTKEFLLNLLHEGGHLFAHFLKLEYGSIKFFSTSFSCVMVLFFIGGFTTKILSGSGRGLMRNFLGNAFPVVFAFLAYGAVKESQEVLKLTKNSDMIVYFAILSSVGVGLLTLIIITPFFYGTGPIRAVIVFAAVMGVMVGYFYVLKVGLSAFQKELVDQLQGAIKPQG